MFFDQARQGRRHGGRAAVVAQGRAISGARKKFQRAVERLLRARFLLLTFLSREQRKVSRQEAKKRFDRTLNSIRPRDT
jgi:hypothetical protein